MTPMDHFKLWQRTLADQSDAFNTQREILRQAFLSFRHRSAQLVSEIGGLLPGLTVHDITHLDALWRVADEIAGPDYPLNPAEAFVLGGAFLLHDAAHVLAAYDDGLAGIKRSLEWKDLIAQRFGKNEPPLGSPQERSALFQVLRHLHAKQARQLANVRWKVPTTGEQLHLLEHFQLREYYGNLIGEIAESHHWPAHCVAQNFENRHVSAPGFLAPAEWGVDALKIAFLLRTADAAHIDGQRAPWFLFALRQPDGISRLHWQFQAKMGQPVRTGLRELRLSSGGPFNINERQAWWLAYEAACMIDRELRDAQILMRDAGEPPFATIAVEHSASPEAFAINVRTIGWEPVNVAPKIGDVGRVIANLGGARLYGNRPELALRELIQNAADAVRALRTLDESGPNDGEIEIALVPDGDITWLQVTDTGIGMSRFVLTEVLLDFGNSLWSSESLRNELPGLASRGFKAVGRFGIGFFSVFMLGRKVQVITRRISDQWLLEFENGLDERPTLRRPSSAESLRRSGTRISVAMDHRTLQKLLKVTFETSLEVPRFWEEDHDKFPSPPTRKIHLKDFRALAANLCPTLDVKVCVKIPIKNPVTAVNPDDWKKLKPERLFERVRTGHFSFRDETLIDLREPSGALVGRIGHARSWHRAVVTHGGIRSGSVPNLAGVLLGENNSDLARYNSRPIASPEAWQKWAEQWIDSSGHQDADALAELHSLCPQRDLPVYRLEGKQFSEAELMNWLSEQNELTVLEGYPTHQDHDDISRDCFSVSFKLSPGILVLPSLSQDLARSLGFQLVNYRQRLEKGVEKSWGEFEISDRDWILVGEACGVDITRCVTFYKRSRR